MNYNYNVLTQPTDKNYKDEYLGTGKYLKVHSAPSNANIQIKVGSTTAKPIKLEKGSKVVLDEIQDFYFSSSVVANDEIEFILSDTNKFNIEDSTSISRLEELSTFGNEAKTLMQFLPNTSFEYKIKANDFLKLDTKNISGLSFVASDVLKMQLNQNGAKFPISANVERQQFLHLVDEVTFYNDTLADVTFTSLVMGNLEINIDYVLAGYVDPDYVY